MTEETNLLFRKKSDYLCRYFPLKEVKYFHPQVYVALSITSWQRNCKGEDKNNSPVEKQDQLCISQVVGVNIISKESSWQHMPLITICWEEPSTSVDFLPRTHNLAKPREKYQTNPKGGTFYKIPEQGTNGWSHQTQRKIWETKSKEKDRETRLMWYPGRDLRTGKESQEKTNEIQTEYQAR